MPSQSTATPARATEATARAFLRLIAERIQRAFPAFLIVAAGAHLLLTTARSHIPTGDSAAYMGLARALAAGEGYVFNGAPQLTYPPGFPLLLAPVVALFGADTATMQRYVALWALIAVVAFLVYLESRRDASVPIATLLFLMSAPFYRLATLAIQAEMPYIAFSIGFLAVAERFTRSGQPSLRFAWAGAILVSLTVATRTVGIALPAAIAATMLHQLLRHWRQGKPRPRLGFAGASLSAGALVFIAWSAWAGQHPRPSSYYADEAPYTELIRLKDPHHPTLGLAAPGDLVPRIAGRLKVEAAHIAELLTNLPWLKPMWCSPLVLLLLLLVVAGWRREFRRPAPFAAWYVAAYLTILVLWPFDEGMRFALPILPLLLIFLINGAEMVARRIAAMDAATTGRIGLVIALLGVSGALVEAKIGGAFSRQDLAAVGFWAIFLVGSGVVLALSGRLTPPRLAHWLSRPVASLYCSGFLVLGFYTISGQGAANVQGRTSSPHVPLREAAAWIAKHTDPSVIIMADEAAGVHVQTGRRTVRLPLTDASESMLAALERERPALLLIIDPPEHPYYFPTEVERLELIRAAAPGLLDLVHTFDGGRIFAVSRPR